MSKTPNCRILPFVCIHNIFYLLCYLFHVYVLDLPLILIISEERYCLQWGRVGNFLIYFQFAFLVEFLYENFLFDNFI